MICQRCGEETSTAICSNCGYFNDEPNDSTSYSSGFQPTMTSKDAKDAWEAESKAGIIHKALGKAQEALMMPLFVVVLVAIVLETILAFFAPSVSLAIGGISSTIGALSITVVAFLILPNHILQIVSFRGYLKRNNIIIEPAQKNDTVYTIYSLTKSTKNIVVYSIYIAFLAPMVVFFFYVISFIPMIYAGFIAMIGVAGKITFVDVFVAFAYTGICFLGSFIVIAIIFGIMNFIKNKLIK